MEFFSEKVAKLLEKENGNFILWLPVIFILGIILRFRVDESPNILNIFLMILLILLVIINIITKKFSIKVITISIIFGILGYIRTDFVVDKHNFPVIKEPTGRVKITGVIEKEIVNVKKNKQITKDIVVVVEKIESFNKKFEKDETPKKLQIRMLNAKEKIYFSDVILTAQIFPIENKALPSSFDKKRYLYFKEIGGLGYKGKIIKNNQIENELTIKQKIDAFRFKIAKRIMDVRPESKSAGIVAILLTGQKNLADKEAINNMNLSGLAHLLSISGLHMMILIGFSIFITRWFLLRNEKIANKYNIFKLSAIVSLIINFFYLLLSGANISAVRAYIMSVILLFSIVINRFNTTLRSVMFTMFILVFLKPYVIYTAGFQLSFSAVIVLVAIIEYYYEIKYSKENSSSFSHHRSRRKDSDLIKIIEYFKLSLLLSFAVECATTPFSIYNFNNYSFYNILVNGFLTPVVTFFVLPLSIISLILMPLKLEFLTILSATYGMDLVLWVSNSIVNLPKSVMFIRSPNSFSMFFMILGLLWFCLWRSKLRKYGILFYGVGLIILSLQKTPDIILDNRNGTIFLFDRDFYVLRPDKYKTAEIVKKFGKIEYFNLKDVKLNTCKKIAKNRNNNNFKKVKCSRFFEVNGNYYFFKNGDLTKIKEVDGKYEIENYGKLKSEMEILGLE